MALESLVIIVLTLLLCYSCIRRGRRAAALGVMPLAIVPLFNLAAIGLCGQLSRLWATPELWRVGFVLLGLLLSGAIFGGISRSIRSTATVISSCGPSMRLRTAPFKMVCAISSGVFPPEVRILRIRSPVRIPNPESLTPSDIIITVSPSSSCFDTP